MVTATPNDQPQRPRDWLRAQRFKQFHLANPHIYGMLLESARRLKQNRRVQHWGMRNLWEKLRYDLALRVQVIAEKETEYKLNDHYPPYYARMMVRDFPEEFEGWLEIRGNRCRLPEGV